MIRQSEKTKRVLKKSEKRNREREREKKIKSE